MVSGLLVVLMMVFVVFSNSILIFEVLRLMLRYMRLLGLVV